MPGAGNVDEYAVTVTSFTAGQSTGLNQPTYSVGVTDGADSSSATAFNTITVTEAPLTLDAVATAAEELMC